MEQETIPRFGRPKAVARALDTSERKICKMLDEGRLKGLRLGRELRIDLSSLEDFIAKGGDQAGRR